MIKHNWPSQRKWDLAIEAVLGNWFMPWFAVVRTYCLPQSNCPNTTHALEKYIMTVFDMPSNTYTKLVLKAYTIGERHHAPNSTLSHFQ